MTVVGTVGHVDHGKTVLLQALTGIDADRLPEEKRRGVTIDVGYAHMPLADGGSLDFVDLPGHHDYTGNLLVGAAEADAALLVVAADAGPEAQTFEHLDVLAAFRLHRGVVAISKVDLVDIERRAEVLDEVRALVVGTALDGAPVVAVSARTGEGMAELRAALGSLDMATPRPSSPSASSDTGSARLAVDRAFTVRGRGMVVTGTLRGGRLAVGDGVLIVPGEQRARVRGLQVHGADVGHVAPGIRVAVNVSGCDSSALRRGVVLTARACVVASERLLVIIEETASAPDRSRVAVKVHIGTDHVPGTLRWIDEPGEGRPCVALVSLERPVAAAVGDRLLVRLPSPPRVVGGGWVLDPQPPRLRTRQLRERLSSARGAAPLTALLRYRLALPVAQLRRAASALGVDEPDSPGLLPGASVIGPIAMAPGLEDSLRDAVREQVRRAPVGSVMLAGLRRLVSTKISRLGGVSRRESDAAAGQLLEVMTRTGALGVRGTVAFDPRPGGQASVLEESELRLLASLDTPRPPAVRDAIRAAGYPHEGLSALIASGRLVQVAPDIAFADRTYQELERLALEMAWRGCLSAAAFRDAAATSRRHAVAVLDRMAAAGLLRREEGGHVPGPRAPAAGAPHATGGSS
jgi:selenocysteine-specific elongation factor